MVSGEAGSRDYGWFEVRRPSGGETAPRESVGRLAHGGTGRGEIGPKRNGHDNFSRTTPVGRVRCNFVRGRPAAHTPARADAGASTSKDGRKNRARCFPVPVNVDNEPARGADAATETTGSQS